LHKKLFVRITIYCILFTALLVYGIIQQENQTYPWFFIGTLGATSAIYISSYIGLKLGRYRIKKDNKLRKWLERIYIPGKEIIIHICIVIVCIILMPVNSTTYSAVQENKVEKELLIKIEKEFGRIDISSIVEIDGKYIITFSDKSRRVLAASN
jgi:hypothetical protein